MHPALRKPLSLLALLLLGGTAMWLALIRFPMDPFSPEAVPRSLPARIALGATEKENLSVRKYTPPEAFEVTDTRLGLVADSGRRLPDRLRWTDQLLAQALSPEELADVVKFLTSKMPAGDGAIERERGLRNHLLNRLREHPGHMGLLVPSLLDLAANPYQDPGLRDYALQHLATWAPQLDQALREQAISGLKAALREPDATYAGTALLGLGDLYQCGVLNEFEPAAEVRRIAGDAHISILPRLTALALATELEIWDPALIELAQGWTITGSAIPEGARRAAQAYLNKHASLN